MMIDIFTSTKRPDPGLHTPRNDPNDPRLGDVIRTSPDRYDSARSVILGCPQDDGVRRNNGRTGAAAAPSAIRRALYRLTTFGIDLDAVFDLGDLVIRSTLEETHDLQRQTVEQLLCDGKVVISLGGGNDISYPDVSALSHVYPNPLVFNIDAHFDVRADAVRNSGTPYRQLLDEEAINAARFCEIGYQQAVNSKVYFDYLNALGVRMIPFDELRASGVASMFLRKIEEVNADAIFWGVDMDVVCAADAPGVSAPAAIGLSGSELCLIAKVAGRAGATRIFEITEVNPLFDIDDRTARLAAAAIHQFLVALSESRRSAI
ncbi:MAG: formimidoylglutamase [Acidobacteria bacterium]|nr:formimidoylglutamase [Acidobacteriota bacterium]MCW5967213.1 formimidoylglutamase [Blastocatellales bacterium]